MNKVQAERLVKLVNHLYSEPKNFAFNFVAKSCTENICGTLCCAIGMTPILFPRYVSFTKRYGKIAGIHGIREFSGLGEYRLGQELFGITEMESEQVFFNESYNIDKEYHYGLNNDDVTPIMVADELVRLLNRYGFSPKTRKSIEL